MQMEKENREVIENAEQKEDDSVKSNGKDRKKDRKWFTRIKAYIKKHPYRILAVILLCIALFFVLRETGVISKHVYEEVENLGEREGVCFDNLLLSSCITMINNSGEKEYRYLCIFNTGDIYCFEWAELTPWEYYYNGNEVYGYKTGYDESNWEKMSNVIYLGRLSNWETYRLNRYIQNYDAESEYYSIWNTDSIEVPNGNGQNQKDQEQLEEPYIWKYYNVKILWDRLQGRSSGKFIIIESSEMNDLFVNVYVKGELRMKSYDKNAIAVLKLFESSLFYYRWVYMCLNNG